MARRAPSGSGSSEDVAIVRLRGGRVPMALRLAGAVACAVAALVLAPIVLGIAPPPTPAETRADRPPASTSGAGASSAVNAGPGPDDATAARTGSLPETSPAVERGLPPLRPRAVRRPMGGDSTADGRSADERRAARREARASRPGAPEISRADFPAPEDLPPEERTGIGLFPLPGTSPPLAGIVVPDGFELPEGYVRHYQATDDGRLLPPILMFSPDYEWVDEAGRPIDVPESRVVDRSMAPPGMPIELLEPPGVERHP